MYYYNINIRLSIILKQIKKINNIAKQINRLKNHKSPGEDDLQGEVLKH
jgi:hypothetical protein